jgi:UDP-glucose 4-epimerase
MKSMRLQAINTIPAVNTVCTISHTIFLRLFSVDIHMRHMYTATDMNVSGSRILVTGASGFIGSMLCDRLQNKGGDIHAVSRIVRDDSRKGIQWWQGDLADHETVRYLFESIRPDYVYHLASEVTGSRDLALVMPTFNANLLASVNILIAATEYGCQRIVMAGSLEEPVGEEQAATPSSPYAAAKWAASAYARMFYNLYQTPVVLARLFMVYGPGQRDLTKLVPHVTLSLLRGESPKLSSGQRPVDWVYVEDIVDGLMAMASSPGIIGSTLDLGSGQLMTTRRVVEMLSAIIGADKRPEFGSIPDRPYEQIRSADIDATHRILGWRPVVSLQQGLEKTVDWYRMHDTVC